MAINTFPPVASSTKEIYDYKIAGSGSVLELNFVDEVPAGQYSIDWSIAAGDTRTVKVYLLNSAGTVITSGTVVSPNSITLTSAQGIKKLSLEVKSGGAYAGANGFVYLRKVTQALAVYDAPGATTMATDSSITYQWEGAHGFIKGSVNAAFYAAGSTNLASSGNNTVSRKFDPATNAISLIASSPTRDEMLVGNTGTATAFYIVRATSNDNWANLNATISEYTAATNSWTNKASSPETGGGNGLAVAGSDDKIYYGGGYTGSSQSTNFYVYDPATNTHTAKAALPAASTGTSSTITSVNGVVYVFAENNSTVSRKYDIASNTWTSIASIPSATGMYGGGAVAFSSTKLSIYNADPTTKLVYDYNPVANTYALRGLNFSGHHYKGGYFGYNGNDYAWLGNQSGAPSGNSVERITTGNLPAYIS